MPVAIALPLVALGALRSHACGNSLASVPLDALHSHAYGVLHSFNSLWLFFLTLTSTLSCVSVFYSNLHLQRLFSHDYGIHC